MRLDPVYEFVRHQVGDGFAVAANDNGRTVLFNPRQQAGKVRFRFMNIDRLHGDYVSPVSPLCQGRSSKMETQISRPEQLNCLECRITIHLKLRSSDR